MVRALQVPWVTRISSSYTTAVTFRSPKFNSQAGKSPEVYKPYLTTGRACQRYRTNTARVLLSPWAIYWDGGLVVPWR